jgi:POT family proton-dependent oligopeptide transporter
MVLGLLQFHFGGARLGSAGLLRPDAKQLTGSQRNVFWAAIVLLAAVVALGLTGVLRLSPVAISQAATVFIVAVAVIYFGSVYMFGKLDRVELKRMHVIVLLFLGSALFWAGFEQAGSSFNLFADRFTNRMIGSFEVPAGWYQSLGPIFVIVCAPVFAALWVALGRRGRDPSIPVKFGLGLILLGAGFLVMAGATGALGGGGKAAAWWLVATYLLHTFGEMCISPVGLSSVTKLAPQRFVGQMMGTWFLGSSLGNLIAGQLAGGIEMDTALPQPSDFLGMLWVPLIAGVLLIAFSPWIKRWSEGVK